MRKKNVNKREVSMYVNKRVVRCIRQTKTNIQTMQIKQTNEKNRQINQTNTQTKRKTKKRS